MREEVNYRYASVSTNRPFYLEVDGEPVGVEGAECGGVVSEDNHLPTDADQGVPGSYTCNGQAF